MGPTGCPETSVRYYHYTYLLTYSMVQSPSWEANWFAASHEIPRISRNPKVHYRTHKRPSPVSILGQPNPVHIPTSRLLEIRPNIIHTFMPRSTQWSLSLRFPHQDPIHPPLLTNTLRNILMSAHVPTYRLCLLWIWEMIPVPPRGPYNMWVWSHVEWDSVLFPIRDLYANY